MRAESGWAMVGDRLICLLTRCRSYQHQDINVAYCKDKYNLFIN